MNNFDFIRDNKLKTNLTDSVRFISALWVLALENKKLEAKEEFYRTIILYSASIIEALLLNYCKVINLKFFEEKYSKSHSLPKIYQSVLDIEKYQDGEVVLAVKYKIEKKYHGEITFSDLLNQMEIFLGKHLVKRITEVKNIRNTLHLHKSREKLKIKDVEKATDIVLKVVNRLSKDAQKQKIF
jgi:hypothetical protein